MEICLKKTPHMKIIFLQIEFGKLDWDAMQVMLSKTYQLYSTYKKNPNLMFFSCENSCFCNYGLQSYNAMILEYKLKHMQHNALIYGILYYNA
jgi:hypothetical protein